MKYILFCFLIFSNVACSPKIEQSTYSDPARIKSDLKKIVHTKKSRNYLNTDVLNQVADYIFQEFSKNCDTVFYQLYTVNGREYKNVIGIIGKDYQSTIVVGAHYDVAGEQQGADDNASGIAGLLELNRMIDAKNCRKRIELVAYSLEEPPFFRTEYMGSYIHAKSLYDSGTEIDGMICLEMIGYFNNEKNSQEYPVGLLKPFYGSKGNYITVVQKLGNGKFGRRVNRNMKNANFIETKSFKAPAKLPGIDFSDHLNYWKFGYSAVMITNTAFYRNKNYHQTTDILETLDIEKMSQVIDEVHLTILNL